MHEILSNKQMARADRLTTEGGTTGWTLMQNAGAHIARIVADHYPAGLPVLVLCGPGNNGGDGFVAARILKDRGRDVRLACLVKTSGLKGDAARACQDWNGQVSGFEEISRNLPERAVVVDAVFGTGFNKQLDDPVSPLFAAIEKAGLPVVAVDIPSGVNGDDGLSDPLALRANQTVTFFRQKCGHVLEPGKSVCGDIILKDIGIRSDVISDTGFAALENCMDLWFRDLPARGGSDHKYKFGHAKIYGAEQMTGASRMAAEACARIGSGLTTVVSSCSGDVYRCTLPPHIIVRDDLSWEDARISAVLAGPGGMPSELDLEPEIARGRSLVLDADAVQAAPKMLHERVVLTPHEGEFARAFPHLNDGSRINRAARAAQETGAVIVLKGGDTVIAHPGCMPVVNTNAPPGLATAGTGDVLAGMIAGLCAQGMQPFEASCAAVWIHGRTAGSCGSHLVATDLIERLKSIDEMF